MKWVSLHHHSTHSFMDGYGTPKQHVARAGEIEMGSLALTEHGGVSSHVQLEKAGKAAGIKPIFGCELYTGDTSDEGRSRYKWHLTVLAENQTGYANLMRLVSLGWDQGFYYEPTVSGAMLAEHSEGLIVLSGCSSSKMACDLLGGKGVDPHDADLAAATKTAKRFQAIFGDRFYLEMQAFPELERTRAINQAWQAISDKTGIQTVATGDVHYPRPDDNEMQVILHAAGRGTNSYEKQAQSWSYDVHLSPPLTDASVIDKIARTGLTGPQAERAVRHAGEIADRCNVVLPKAERLRYPTADGEDTTSVAWRWLREGWAARYPKSPNMRKHKWDYVERLKYEMQMIESKDFLDYFLMLSDIVRFAKDKGIPVGPARGSAAASLVCYLLRITEVDPMLFPSMVFERFIDITRYDLPDVDLDFDDERRDEIRQYAVSKYGADRVGNIGNFVRYRGKNALDDVSRVFRLPKAEVEKVKKLVLDRSGGDSRFDASLADTAEMFPVAKKVFEDHPELWKAVRLEGNLRGMSVHAAGIVISNDPITQVCAMYSKEYKNKEGKVAVLSVDKYDADYLGLLKADFLGLTTMGMIRIALDEIGMTLAELYEIPLDDPKTLAAFKANDLIGIFQFEGRATRLVNRDVSPDNFMELADINTLSRPGPLFSGATASYVETKHGKIARQKFHPVVDALTGDTQNQIIYQEQILRIVREVGGFDWTDANEIRKIISKKLGEGAFNNMQARFVEGAERLHGMDVETAQLIWKQLVTSGTYVFNVAHSISYSMIGFWCMWLKQHHPQAFYMAQLRKTPKESWPKLIKDAERHGVPVRGPDLQLSGRTWAVSGDAIVAGFEQVDGIGEAMAGAIMADREANGPFADWADLERVRGIGPKKIEIIRAKADSDDPFGLKATGRILDLIRKEIRSGALGPLPKPTYTSDEIPPDADNLPVVYLGMVKAKNYQDFVENQRSRTGEEVEDIIARMVDKDKVTSCVLQSYDDGDEEVYLRFERRFVYPRHKAALESLRVGEDVVLIEGMKRSGFGTAIHVKRMWVIDPTG